MTRRVVPVLEMMRMQIDTMFAKDQNGRLQNQNDLERTSPCRLFLGRTASDNIWRFSADLPGSLAKELEQVLRKEPPLRFKTRTDLPKQHGALKEILAAHSPIEKIWSGPAFYFSETPPMPEGTIAITKANRDLLQGELEPWQRDADFGVPLVASLEDGIAASVCASARMGNKAHEAGVETSAAYRGKGHALRAVSAWANLVAQRGVLPLYSTSWENEISQKIAARLGLTFYGAGYHIT